MISALLALAADLDPTRAVVVTASVLTGQLTIGWGNDLLDLGRDRQVGRADKPLATGELSARPVMGCLAAAGAACVVLSFAAGVPSAMVHLGLVVFSGHAYNFGAKSTAFSWLPYAVAFGSLPAVVTLAGDPSSLPPWWMVATAAGLGVAVHFLNVMPDLDADEATGVRGLPHRLGATASRVTATVLLLVASVAVVLGPSGVSRWGWLALVVVGCLAAVAFAGRGRVPFQAAVAIALLDVVLLATADPVRAGV